MLKNFIWPIVVTVIGIIFQNHFFKDEPALVFSVSEAIKITGEKKESSFAEYAQQISVLNQGTAIATKVSIKVPSSISTYELVKHSNLEKEQTTLTPAEFELQYPELPPDQKLLLVIRYSGLPIFADRVKVTHAHGTATSALDSEKKLFFHIPTMIIVLWIGFLLSSFQDIRKTKQDSFLRYPEHDQILREKKPWFVSQGHWPALQKKAIISFLNSSDWADRIPDIKAYQLLSADKPNSLTDADWRDIIKEASNTLTSKLNALVNRRYKFADYKELLQVAKPTHFSQSSWNEFLEKVQDQILAKLFSDTYLTKDSLIPFLTPNTPETTDLPDRLRGEVIRKARAKFFEIAATELITSGTPTTSLELLEERQASKLNELTEKLERINHLPRSWRPVELKGLLENGKPTWMSDREFEAIKEFIEKSEQLDQQSAELRKQQLAAASEMQSATGHAKMVENQLKIIHEALSDPTAIDRIESYNGTFAPGNLANLARLCKLNAK